MLCPYFYGTQHCCVLIFMAHNEAEGPDTAVPFPYRYLVKYRYSVGTQQCCVLICMAGNSELI